MTSYTLRQVPPDLKALLNKASEKSGQTIKRILLDGARQRAEKLLKAKLP
jgi:uncharacterized protein (DUF1778 family)